MLDGTSVYEEGVAVFPYYNFAMMVDMEEMMHQWGLMCGWFRIFSSVIRFLPPLHYSHTVYLRGRVVYPNLVLLYKGEKIGEFEEGN